jgi:hypothetical protein
MRKAPQTRLRTVVAAVLAAIVSVQLAFAVTAHDPVHHEGGDDHGCVICTFSHAQEVGAPVLGEIVSPLTTRVEAPDTVVAPRLVAAVASHLARGPPSLLVA